MNRFAQVALAGRPNVGKSSLLNAILGTHLAMVSPKAQASRLPVSGIYSADEVQLEFVDLPGLLDPEYLLHASMRQLALDALARADMVLHLHPAPEAPAPDLLALVPELPGLRVPVLTVYTKGDLLSPADRSSLESAGSAVVAVGDPGSLEALLARLSAIAPVGEFRHDPENLAIQPVRFFVGEYLREAAFELLDEELPYALVAEVDEFREGTRPVYIRATLYVERESQKGIVIGRGGSTLKRIGSHARNRLEALLGEPVYLETWVKVLPKWRRSSAALARFGFPIPDPEGR